MPDIKLQIGGDGSGAEKALTDVAKAAGDTARGMEGLGAGAGVAESSMSKAVATGMLMAEAIKAVAEKLFEFGKESIAAYAEQERADKQLSASLEQLGYDSQKLTPFLKEQAEAFEKNLGVSNEMVEKMQALMITFGVAPKDIEKTTQAILDYSARTGRDAPDATFQLLKAVEAGGAGLSRLGINIHETGNKTVDLEAAVKAMSDRFGGAAAADATTYAGKLRIMEVQVEDLKKSFGGFLVSLEERMGVLDKVTGAFKTWDYIFNGGMKADAAQQQRAQQLVWTQEALISARADLKKAVDIGDTAAIEAAKGRLDVATVAFKEARKQIDDASGKITEGEAPANLERSLRAGNEYTQKAIENARKLSDAREENNQRDLDDAKAKYKEMDELEERAAKNNRKWLDEMNGDLKDWSLTDDKIREKQIESTEKDLGRIVDDAVKDREKMRDAGAQMGLALVSAIDEQIQRAQSGGDVDIGLMMLSIVQGAVSVVLTGMGLGWAAPLASGVLGLAGHAAGIGSHHGAGRAHDGAWSDNLPRFHDGGEVPAWLLPGERVLSHREISTMGGSGQVDNMARGGGGRGNYTIVMANDAKSFQERVGSDQGSAIVRSVRQNRGELAQMLRRMGADI